MNIRHAALAVASICVLVIAGCGSGTNGEDAARSQAHPAALPHTLVGEDYNSVMLLETDTEGGDILGTFDYSEADGTEVKHEHGKVTGTVNGSRVTLTLGFGFGDTALKGTLSGTTLTLRAPQADGRIEDYVMEPNSVDYYNQRVDALKAGVGPTSEEWSYY